MTPEIALRDAVIAQLLASPAIAELVGEKVYDSVPSDNEAAELPWICMGPITTRPIDMGCNSAWSVSMKVFAESSAFDRFQAWQIARAAIRVLNKVSPPVDGLLDELKITGAGDVQDPGEIKTVWFDVTTMFADLG